MPGRHPSPLNRPLLPEGEHTPLSRPPLSSPPPLSPPPLSPAGEEDPTARALLQAQLRLGHDAPGEIPPSLIQPAPTSPPTSTSTPAPGATGTRSTLVSTEPQGGTLDLWGHYTLVVAAHIEDPGSAAFLDVTDVAYYGTWEAEARRVITELASAGIPLHLQVAPGAALAFLSQPAWPTFVAWAVEQGTIFDGRAHAKSQWGNAADAVYYLQQAGAPFSGILGSYEAGQESALAGLLVPSRTTGTPMVQFRALTGGDVAGHLPTTGSTQVTEGIQANPANPTQAIFPKGTSASVAAKNIVLSQVAAGTIPAGVGTIRINAAPRRDGTLPAFATPAVHTNGKSSHILAEVANLLTDADQKGARNLLAFATYRDVLAAWARVGYKDLTYSVTLSAK